MKTLDLSRIGTVYIACGYSDLRRGINGLVAQVQQQFRLDPREQAVFLFCGKGRFARGKSCRKATDFDNSCGFGKITCEATGSRHCSGTETDSYYCTSVWRTDDTSGREAGRKYRGSRNSNIVGSWRD